jgi:hypothetical protein
MKMFGFDLALPETRRLVAGLAAVACYAAYAWQCVRARKSENALWACHLGCLLVGLGWLARGPSLNAIGLLWLLPGILLWGLYLAGGGAFTWTSLLTHAGGNLLGLWGAAVLGVPSGAGWQAAVGYALLVAVSRRVSTVAGNVNFSRQVWRGWEARFPSYARYLTGLLLGALVLFLALELLLRQLLADGRG